MGKGKGRLSGLTDEELVVLAQSGDISALNVLADRMGNYALYCAGCYGNAHREDLAQDGMFGLMSAVRTYSPEKNAGFRTYATVCIRNAVINAAKTSKYGSPKGEVLVDDITAEGFEPDPEDVLLQKEAVAGLYAFINDELSDFERNVIGLFLEGKSYREISLALSKSEKAVDNALTRVRSKIKNRL